VRILVIGATGYLGQEIASAMMRDHDVVRSAHRRASLQRCSGTQSSVPVELHDPRSITAALAQVEPDAIVYCAGKTEEASAGENPEMVGNLLAATLKASRPLSHVILCGTAAVYGRVDPAELPVAESIALNAASKYAQSKRAEEEIAAAYREEHGSPVTVARIFNPIGPGVSGRILLAGLMRQVGQIRAGTRAVIEVSRRDAERDCIATADVGAALVALLSDIPKHAHYNVGTGIATTNGELVDLVLRHGGLSASVPVIESAREPEPTVASRADVSRLSAEFGWLPKVSVDEAVRRAISG
jgi:nucleoside-diphosphate-sugar epimerase